MIAFIKKHLFGKTEQMLIEKENNLDNLKISLEANNLLLRDKLYREVENEKELLKIRVNKVNELLDTYESKIKRVDTEYDIILKEHENIKLERENIVKEKQKAINDVINIRGVLEKRFNDVNREEKDLRIKHQILKEKSKKIAETRKVIEEEKNFYETTIRGRKCLVDKYGNFKRFV